MSKTTKIKTNNRRRKKIR